MINILVHGPDFACSENLTRVFDAWGDVQLISLNDTDWREYDPGTIITAENTTELRQSVEESSLVLLGDATAFKALRAIAPKRWKPWARKLNLAAFFGDSAYFNKPEYFDQLCQDLNIGTVFLLPNLVPLATIPVVPLHHPMPVMPQNRHPDLTIMHSPGRPGKAGQKGTGAIEAVLQRIASDGFEFRYERIMYTPLVECLRLKAQAHIFIDQLPPPDLPSGVGRSGLEALALGCATFSTMYDPAIVDGYFDPPPVLGVRSEETLEAGLRAILSKPHRRERAGQRGTEWVKRTVEFEPWLEYVGRFVS